MTERACTLHAGVRVERGTPADWRRLAPLHYRGHRPGAVTDVFRMVHREPGAAGAATLVGVIVYARSPLSLAARNRATGGRYRLGRCGRVALGVLVNRELRMVARVVVAPNWRGLGLASRLVRETLPKVGTPYVEALAAMGRVHPFFARAGMTAYPPPPAPKAERLAAALEAAVVPAGARQSGPALAAALGALPPALAAQMDRELARWARSYLGAKNHRTPALPRDAAAALAARHLGAAPVYYLWRRPPGAPPQEATP